MDWSCTDAFASDYLASEAIHTTIQMLLLSLEFQVFFNICIEDELSKIYAGEYDAQTGADRIAAAWEITDQIGRESQIKLYKASLGL